MAKRDVSVAELVSMIKKSNTINIVIEGRDDVVAYRHIEARLNSRMTEMASLVSLVPAGGREKVLQIFDALSEDKALNSCFFICDKDLWVFSGVPDQYLNAKIVTTDGYSIENDILRDYDVSVLFDKDEHDKFKIELACFKEWFAYVLANNDSRVSTHVNEIVGNKKDRALVKVALESDPKTMGFLSIIATDEKKYLRGKSFLDLYIRQLSAPKRKVKHSTLSIFEHAAAAGGENLRKIETSLLQLLHINNPAS